MMLGAAKIATGRGALVEQRIRMLDGAEVKVTKYFGIHAGHGNYMAGTVDGDLVCDSNGKPIPYKKIGHLEVA